MTGTLLDIRGLSVDYETARGPLKALRDVSLTVPEGQIVGVVGESGCGKSTLIASILRLAPPNARVRSGQIVFGGRDLLRASDREMRALRGADIAIVFQDPMQSHNPVLSIGTQMIDIQHRDAVPKAEKRRRAADMLNSVGIPDANSRLANYPHEFSGGMRQRIAIAMALMSRPDLLIADEPTTALDATLEVQIIQMLKAMQSERRCSILFISHHLGVIAQLCDRVVVMYAGEVVEAGPVRKIFREPGHPYTRRLIECYPGRARTRARVLPTIPGELPDLVAPPRGCVFRDRCKDALPHCAEQRPSPAPCGNLHTVSCWLTEESPSA